jgi:hypothetical protein
MNPVIGLIPSVNGYGHTRRLISIALALEKKGFKIIFLLSCGSMNSDLSTLISKYSYRIDFYCALDKLEGFYVKKPAIHSCSIKRDKKFSLDFVISDSLLWVESLKSHSILIAQFIWEDYYEESRETILIKLTSFKKIFGQRYFSTKILTSNHNFQEIPLLDYWNLRNYLNTESQDRIAVAWSGAENIYGLFPTGTLIENFPIIKGMEKFLKSNFKPLGVICRPGLGAISECLSAGIIPILINTTDKELVYNSKVAFKFGWAIPFEDIKELSFKEQIDFIKEFKTNLILPHQITSELFVSEYLIKELR